MQDVFGGNGFFADAAFGKRQVFSDGWIEVMTHHQHVHVFIQRVDGVGACRVGGGGQHIGFAHHFQNVGCMTAPCAFGVEGVDGAAFEGRHGVFHKTRFVQGVGVDGHLGVGVFGHVQAVVDGRRRGTPVFVQFQANCAGIDLLVQSIRQGRIALAQKAQVHGKRICRLQHAFDVPRAGRAGGGKGACGRASAAAQHGGHTAAQGFFNLLRRDEMDVCVNGTSGHDDAFARNDFGAWANDDVHTGLGIGVTGFANGRNAGILDADVGFHNAPVVEDERVGQDAVHRATRLRARS